MGGLGDGGWGERGWIGREPIDSIGGVSPFKMLGTLGGNNSPYEECESTSGWIGPKAQSEVAFCFSNSDQFLATRRLFCFWVVWATGDGDGEMAKKGEGYGC